MNEQDLRKILERNPAISVAEGVSDPRQVPPKVEKRRAPDALAKVAEGETASMGCPVVSFTFYRTRLVDVDALNPKDLIDGLCKAGLLPGDKVGETILAASEQIKVDHRSEEETVITIRYE
jgi:hypothetical protein